MVAGKACLTHGVKDLTDDPCQQATWNVEPFITKDPLPWCISCLTTDPDAPDVLDKFRLLEFPSDQHPGSARTEERARIGETPLRKVSDLATFNGLLWLLFARRWMSVPWSRFMDAMAMMDSVPKRSGGPAVQVIPGKESNVNGQRQAVNCQGITIWPGWRTALIVKPVLLSDADKRQHLITAQDTLGVAWSHTEQADGSCGARYSEIRRHGPDGITPDDDDDPRSRRQIAGVAREQNRTDHAIIVRTRLSGSITMDEDLGDADRENTQEQMRGRLGITLDYSTVHAVQWNGRSAVKPCHKCMGAKEVSTIRRPQIAIGQFQAEEIHWRPCRIHQAFQYRIP
ncbi:unnamed protein product [Diplocarpon coronariae]